MFQWPIDSGYHSFDKTRDRYEIRGFGTETRSEGLRPRRHRVMSRLVCIFRVNIFMFLRFKCWLNLGHLVELVTSYLHFCINMYGPISFYNKCNGDGDDCKIWYRASLPADGAPAKAPVSQLAAGNWKMTRIPKRSLKLAKLVEAKDIMSRIQLRQS